MLGQQENLYNDNLGASVTVLKKLIEEWKQRPVKLTPADTLTLSRTMKSLRLKVFKLNFTCFIFALDADSDSTMF